MSLISLAVIFCAAAAASAFGTLIGGTSLITIPLLIVLGLLTRLAALGMIGFIIVQTATDVIGHGGTLGRLFDARYQLVDERALWVTLLLALVVTGAGALSLDRLATRFLPEPRLENA